MSRKDFYHDYVRAVLQQAGWTVKREFITLPFANTRVHMDLLAENTAADGSTSTVVIEVKNFREETGYVSELQKSIGQYLLYRDILLNEGHAYPLYLAVPATAYASFLSAPLIRNLFQQHQIQLLLFNPQDPTSLRWNP